MRIRFKVKVIATTEETRVAGREWKEVGRDEHDKPRYDYTPEITKTIREDREIYDQEVDELDLSALVSVVNGMHKPKFDLDQMITPFAGQLARSIRSQRRATKKKRRRAPT